MKNLTLLLICITNVVFSQIKPNNDLFKLNLKGKVASISEPTFLQEYCDTTFIMIKLFDELGNINETKVDDYRCHNFSTKVKIVYDSKKRIDFVMNSQMGIDQQKFEYNSKNELISYLDSENDNHFYTHKYKYDQKGNQIEMKVFEEIDPAYDKILKDNGNLLYKITITFDEKDNAIKKEYFNKTNLKTRIESFKYDQNGDVIESNGSNRLKNTEKNPTYLDTPTKTYKYILDEQKNWISKTEYIDSKVTNTTTREIKYY